MIFAHQNLISNWLTYLVHAKSTDELISFGFSDRSVISLVSAKRSGPNEQEAQLSQRGRATLRVTECFAKSLKVIRNDTVE